MPTYIFPTNAELRLVAQEKRATLSLIDPIFGHFPIVQKNTDTIMWEQKDNYIGLQQVRGIGGQFGRVNNIGGKRFVMLPGYYGESMVADEQDLTRLRPLGNLMDTLDATQLVLEKQEQMLSREIDRMRQVAWLLMSTGTFSVQSETGAVVHTDSFSIQSASSAVAWSTRATATPLADLQALNILGRGKGVAFDSRATAYYNQVTVNNLLGNTNASDLFGRRGPSGASIFTLPQLNAILLEMNLPKIAVYDEGYLDNSGTFVPFLADGKGVIVGYRPDGNSLGEIVETRNASNQGGAPGAHDSAVESAKPPKIIEVFRGTNWGPTIIFPGSVIRHNVG